jgi:hypothetical protein
MSLWLKSYELFNEKVFKFDEDKISVDLQYIETLAPSDAVRTFVVHFTDSSWTLANAILAPC